VQSRAPASMASSHEYEPKRHSLPCREEAGHFPGPRPDYIPTQLREHTGELEAAAPTMPATLIGADDLCGIFFMPYDVERWRDSL